MRDVSDVLRHFPAGGPSTITWQNAIEIGLSFCVSFGGRSLPPDLAVTDFRVPNLELYHHHPVALISHALIDRNISVPLPVLFSKSVPMLCVNRSSAGTRCEYTSKKRPDNGCCGNWSHLIIQGRPETQKT